MGQSANDSGEVDMADSSALKGNTTFAELRDLSRELGKPENDYAILAEGNTSARIDAGTFWVKASGYSLRDADEYSFVKMHFDPVLKLLERPDLPEDQLKAALNTAKADASVSIRPSIEVTLHALLLKLGNLQVIGHTHPSAWNAILCSVNVERALGGRWFPDQVVVCGPHSLYIPYVDPGLPLAREVRQRFLAFIDNYGEPPKEILMQNHGLIALGQSCTEVERITAMSVKAARILLGTFALGGPKFLSEQDVLHLWQRPDEITRRARLIGTDQSGPTVGEDRDGSQNRSSR
jgi:rhamnose utilization protein RhaD (predicted bifunctional aldolase and dehydrogenase)